MGKEVLLVVFLGAFVFLLPIIGFSIEGYEKHQETMARIEHGCLVPEVKAP